MTQPRIKRQNLLCPACGFHIAKDIPSLIRHLAVHHRGNLGAKYHLKRDRDGETFCGAMVALSSHSVAVDEFLEQKAVGLSVCKKCDRSAVLIKASIDRIDKAMEGRKLPDDATHPQLGLPL